MQPIKHVGKMKNNGARVVVAYRTLPGDAYNALVISTAKLGESYHDSLISLVQGQEGQDANELAEILAVRKFPDGSTMLHWLHQRGQLIRVPTDSVLMTPTTRETDNISLDMLNQEIAEQRGVSLDELAMTDGVNPNPRSSVTLDDPTKTTSASVNATEESAVKKPSSTNIELTPTELRSRADALFKQAQQLRKQADSIDPPKKKSKKDVSVEVE
jgi:hypothetical protein